MFCVVYVGQQSSDIALGVNEGEGEHKEAGAGDQGLMFGYACNETPELMPLPIMLSHQIIKKVEDVRQSKSIPYLRPDAKTQVTVEYDENDKPIRVDTIVLSTQHDEVVTQVTIKKDIEALIREVVDEKYLIDTKFFINPTAQFVTVVLKETHNLLVVKSSLILTEWQDTEVEHLVAKTQQK